jgi:L-iditol 2-dehydrogenase
MKAARLFGKSDIRIVEEPAPQPEPGKVLLRIEAVAICASDLRLYEEGDASGVVPDHPMIQGHEFSGTVVALGEGVDGPAVGTPVAVEPSWHCGECELCRMGMTNICGHVVFPSFPQEDGALRQYMNCPAFSVCHTGPGMDAVSRALTEPLGVGVHAVRLADMKPQDSIAILGAGCIGMCTMVAAQAAGFADIIVAEPREDRRAFPATLGAHTVAATAADLEAAIGDPVRCPNVVLECSGDNAAVEQAMRLVRPGGKVVVVGIPHPDDVTFNSTVPRRKELTVYFSRRSRNTLEHCVELVEQGRVDLTVFPVKEFSLEDTAAAFEAAQRREPGMLRAVVKVS